ncbi:UPF0702 transmembrane protein YdfR [Sporosarcina sp. NCCP-2222]|uniref:DUF421 domain-containing protein n=1 Tax=Sporosarcina sp. NCCP-2222 TaxID=2935073 RepID=UPI002081F891|nr:YetF domain-containing protein [Sporosarcina sp. NCCP-2222]GKV55181.1 UPF0702 transmembrane protein YdfR [Sporosarcina sp. NCCP-2222]
MEYIWKTLLIFIVATVLLRISGRKSISEMTVPQVVVLFSLGTLIIQPVTGHGLWTTFGLAAILIACLIITEWLQLKFDKSESIITSKGKPIIINGKLQTKNMKKMRLTVDQLEARLRQVGISATQDVKHATLEPNGQLGYELQDAKKPATKEDIQTLIHLIQTGELKLPSETPSNNIFVETITKQSSNESDFLK